MRLTGIAKNYSPGNLTYFMPENDDRVDPGYDFEYDRSVPDRDPLFHDYYAHQFYQQPNYDGILISKVNVDKSKRKQKLIEDIGIHRLLRLPPDMPLMGDCGAFSYIKKESPPYTTDEVLDYYQKYGFDRGVSIDHSIVGDIEKDAHERQRRFDLTLANAKEFLDKHKARGCTFTPIGALQGWDANSYRDGFKALVDMGYQYVSIGGIARTHSKKILEILQAISPLIPNEQFKLHLFGVAREQEVMRSFQLLGVTSFDAASALRRAWQDGTHNYYTMSGDTYTAIRIPEASETKGRVKKILLETGESFTLYQQLEKAALSALRAYDAGQKDIDSTLDTILAYDRLLGGNRSRHADAYRRVLEDQPWKQCGCPICTEAGIDVIIFRGNNRNRRRGFHNTHVYYKRLQRIKNNK